ncbi:MAG: hypothetical protein K0S07_149 [Chlamydiales bacterium]|jgi:hypothetical protein|nr:hypothetical protein [Chlamydiales bacterium]
MDPVRQVIDMGAICTRISEKRKIHLQDAKALDVCSRQKGIRWENSSLEAQVLCTTIDAKKQIHLQNVRALYVQSSTKGIQWINASQTSDIAYGIKACQDIQLKNVSASFVCSDEGTIRWENQQLLPQKTEQIHAANVIEMRSIHAKDVKSAGRKVKAVDCQIDSVFAVQRVNLKNTQVTKSLFLSIDPSRPISLKLEGSVVRGDVVIRLLPGHGADADARIDSKLMADAKVMIRDGIIQGQVLFEGFQGQVQCMGEAAIGQGMPKKV